MNELNQNNIWGAIVDVTGMLVFLTCFLGILGGTAYLVDQRNWSAWWLLPAALLAASISIKTNR